MTGSVEAADRQQALRELERLDAAARHVRTRFGTVAGAPQTMAWRCWGHGPAIVLVHGGVGSWRHWVRNIEHLARNHTVWIADMPGFGDSDVPDGVQSPATLAPMLLDGIGQVLGDAPYDLVGFSFGALVCAFAAAQTAEPGPKPRRLVLIGPAGLGIEPPPLVFLPLRGVTDPIERTRVLSVNLNALMLHHPASVDALAIEIHGHGIERERLRRDNMARSDAILQLAPRWACPAFALFGELDVLYLKRQPALRERLAGLGLRELAFVADAGHWVMYERVRAFHAALDGLLDRPIG
jgi:pimeloyl-ACP methyl ester carboxylesterase